MYCFKLMNSLISEFWIPFLSTELGDGIAQTGTWNITDSQWKYSSPAFYQSATLTNKSYLVYGNLLFSDLILLNSDQIKAN